MNEQDRSPNVLPRALESTDCLWLGERYQGKVRDSYKRGRERILIATDRLSAFDRIIGTVPGKGQVLTAMAQYWFERTGTLIENHIIAMPDPCVMVVHDLSIIPVEVVVRGYVAGSAWRDYQAGRPVSGVRLPPGLKEFDQLPEPIVTPYTKAPVGEHDLPISELELVQRGLVAPVVWEQIRDVALALFSLGSQELASRGLLFVDTKYEFGLLEGRVVLADEIHTLDSSRFWVAESYENRRLQGEAPEMLDKEPIRRWLMEQGFQGDGAIPLLSDVYRRELMDHYVGSFRRITGNSLELNTSEPTERLERNLKRYFGASASG